MIDKNGTFRRSIYLCPHSIRFKYIRLYILPVTSEIVKSKMNAAEGLRFVWNCIGRLVIPQFHDIQNHWKIIAGTCMFFIV